MSLVNGPKKVTIKPPTPDKAAGAMAMAASGAATLVSKLTGIRFDPAPSYLFFVEVSGSAVALFTECSGIGGIRQVEKVSQGGLNDHTITLPGKVDFTNITLKRGLSLSRELWNWFVTGMYDFKVKKMNITITQGAPGMNAAAGIGVLDAGWGILKRWNIEKAYPVSWKLSDLSVNAHDTVAIESVELAHEGISLDLMAGTPLSPAGAIMDLMS